MTVEWLDAAADADADELPDPGAPPARPRRRRPHWAGLAVTGVVVAAAVAGLTQARSHPRHPAAAPPVAQLSRAADTTAAGASQIPAGALGPVPSQIVVPPLLGVTADWDLFARSSDEIVRIQFARGVVTLTQTPILLSEGDVAFVAGPTDVVVRPNDIVAGYLVPDAGAARPLPPVLAGAVDLFPGPTPDTAWVQRRSTSSAPALQLYDLRTNRLLPTLLPVVQGSASPLVPDGSGHVLFNGVGGAYDVRPDGMHRVTTGQIVAIGSTAWVADECDDAFRCSTVVIDQRTGQRRAVGPAPIGVDFLRGAVSADGRYAVYLSDTGSGTETLRLIDLSTGANHVLDVRPGLVPFGIEPFVWSPQGHLLFVIDSVKTLLVVDPATRVASHLGVDLPFVVELAIRPAP